MILIKRHKILAGIMAFLFLAFVSAGITQQMGYFPFSGNTFKIRSGATQTVESGGTINWASGSYLKIGGTTVSGSAAELNYIDGTVLGTAVASKALGLGSTRNVNYLAVNDTVLFDSALLRIATGSTIDIESGGALNIAGAAVTGSATELNYIDGTILGTAVASKALGLGASRNVNYFAIADTGLVDSGTLRLNTGSVLQIDSGASMTINGSPVTTSNLWTGTESVVALLADSTLMSYTSGTTYIARPVAAKTTATLPAAAAGLNYTFFVADADSLLLAAASGDSLIDNTGAAWVTTSSVAGSIKAVALDGVRWFLFPIIGTWASY